MKMNFHRLLSPFTIFAVDIRGTIIFLLASCVALSLQGQPDGGYHSVAGMSFENTIHDFGTVFQKDSPKSHSFVFINTGDGPLVITYAGAACSCVRKTEYPKKPVNPGKSGAIKIMYYPSGIGRFRKEIVVYTNEAQGEYILTIKGEVVKKQRRSSAKRGIPGD